MKILPLQMTLWILRNKKSDGRIYWNKIQICFWEQKKKKKKSFLEPSDSIENKTLKQEKQSLLYIKSDNIVLADMFEKFTGKWFLIWKKIDYKKRTDLDILGNLDWRRLQLNYKMFEIKIHSQQKKSRGVFQV